MKKSSIILITVLFLFSCSHDNFKSVGKVVRFSVGSMCNYDSLGTPHLSIRSYVELSPANKMKIARGNLYYITERNAPPYSLGKFYESDMDDSLKVLIVNTLIKKSYDSSYVDSGDGIWYVLIYKINGKLKQIEYTPDLIPKRLLALHLYLNKKIDSNNNIPVNPFSVDSLLINYERQLFARHAPPPPPAQPDTLVKYINAAGYN